MNFGPKPWHQLSWDWRAAGNFICGGAGAGLIVFTALAGVQGWLLSVLLLAGLALVGLGLLCVWLEIGRPLRAVNVFFNPRQSWMSREAYAATALLLVGLGAATYWPALIWPAAALALAFVYCQGRMLRGAKGIPAWRESLTTPLLVVTGLVEGGALFWLAHAWHGAGSTALLWMFAGLVLLRVLLWLGWRHRLEGRSAPRALAAIDAAGLWVKFIGGALPLVIATWIAISPGGAATTALLAAAALLTLGAGAWFKFTLITRGGFNQGFSLSHLPVRGAPRGAD